VESGIGNGIIGEKGKDHQSQVESGARRVGGGILYDDPKRWERWRFYEV